MAKKPKKKGKKREEEEGIPSPEEHEGLEWLPEEEEEEEEEELRVSA